MANFRYVANFRFLTLYCEKFTLLTQSNVKLSANIKFPLHNNQIKPSKMVFRARTLFLILINPSISVYKHISGADDEAAAMQIRYDRPDRV